MTSIYFYREALNEGQSNSVFAGFAVSCTRKYPPGGGGEEAAIEKLGRKQLLVPKTLPGKPVFFLNRGKFSPILANSHISGR